MNTIIQFKDGDCSSLESWYAIEACAKALDGQAEDGGINWRWFSFFNRENAEKFLSHPGIMEDRGISEVNGIFAVRVR